jgi:hypothetical protein
LKIFVEFLEYDDNAASQYKEVPLSQELELNIGSTNCGLRLIDNMAVDNSRYRPIIVNIGNMAVFCSIARKASLDCISAVVESLSRT